ncbi:MAG: hypothetical protein V4642_01500 [Bacteroidota bacterium]
MKRQNFYSLALKASAVALLLSGTATAQNLENSATGKIQNTGTIKFKKATATLKNDAPIGTSHNMNSGTIEFEQGAAFTATTVGTTEFGLNATNRIPGKVIYSQTTTINPNDPQTITPAYYDSLTLTGNSVKTLNGAYFVSGIYNVDATSVTRNYTGTFTYDSYLAASGGANPTTASVAQVIYKETGPTGGSNKYDNLALTGTAKSIKQNAALNSDVVRLKGTFTNDATAHLYIAGKLEFGTTASTLGPITIDTVAEASLTTGSNLAQFGANVNVRLGSFIVPAEDTATIGSAATLALALPSEATTGTTPSVDAKLLLNARSVLNVTGIYTNAFNTLPGTGYTNATYTALSTVNYNSATANQVIVPSVATNPYSNFKTDAGTKYAGGNIFVADSLTVNNGNLDMTAGTAQANGTATTDHELTMGLGVAFYGTYGTNGGPNVATADEVRGKMTRTPAFATGSTATFATGTAYTYNNINTQVTYTSAGTLTSTLPTSLGFRVLGATSPVNYANGTDIQRKITPTYVNNVPATDNWKATVRAGYKSTTEINTTQWAAQAIPTTEASLRYIESQDQASPNTEKIATGKPYSRPTTPATEVVQWISLEGIGPATDNVNGLADSAFKSGNDLVLRGGPVIFNAIASGRWSNPATWDEGVQPSETDFAVINGFVVHAGYAGRSDGGSLAGKKAELHPTNLAAGITIGGNGITGAGAIATLTGSGLLFGTVSTQQDENGVGQTVPSFSMNPLATITNRAGSSATVLTGADLLAPDLSLTAPVLEGLIIYATSTLQSDDIVNEGRLGNGGTVEIGDTP